MTYWEVGSKRGLSELEDSTLKFGEPILDVQNFSDNSRVSQGLPLPVSIFRLGASKFIN
jgi:hypothetical protein